MTLLRSVVFALLLYGTLCGLMLASLPLHFCPRRWGILAAQGWARFAVGLMRLVPRIECEFRGLERIPEGPLLVVSKHQSAWETFGLILHFRDPAFILKRELMYIPVFGWWMARLRMIAVDRGARSQALVNMGARARDEVAQGRQLLIFPEGTRRVPGEKPAYKFGAAYLYSQLGVPCLPVALNSGLFWPRRTMLKHPGRIVVEFLEPIPPGMDRDAFATLLQERIETASDRLLVEAAQSADPPPLPSCAEARLAELREVRAES